MNVMRQNLEHAQSTHLVSSLLLELARHDSHLFALHLFRPVWREKYRFKKFVATGSTPLLCITGSASQDNAETNLLCHGASTGNLVKFAPGSSAGDSQLSRK